MLCVCMILSLVVGSHCLLLIMYVASRRKRLRIQQGVWEQTSQTFTHWELERGLGFCALLLSKSPLMWVCLVQYVFLCMPRDLQLVESHMIGVEKSKNSAYSCKALIFALKWCREQELILFLRFIWFRSVFKVTFNLVSWILHSEFVSQFFSI